MYEAGDIRVTVGADFRPGGFDAWDRNVQKSEQRSKRPIDADLGADYESKGFDQWERALAQARAQAKDEVKAELKADYDGRGFANFSRGMRDANSGLVQLGTRLPLLKWGVFAAGATAAAVGVTQLVASLGPLVGLLAAVPVGIGVAVQGVSSLLLATRGVGSALGAALDQQTSSGKDAQAEMKQRESAMEAIRSASMALADSHRQEELAQDALTDAVKDARREYQDMKLDAEDAAHSQRGAVRELAEARRDLRKVMDDPDSTGDEIFDARMRVAQGETDVKRARLDGSRAVKDLAAAERAGVKGSDQVVDARRNLRTAERQVAESSRDLKMAVRDAGRQMNESSGGADAYAKAMDKLPPAAQRFVKFLVGMKPAMDDLREASASGLFPGVEKGITSAMGNFDIFKKVIHDTSVEMGSFAADFGAELGSEEWGRDIEVQGARNVVIMDKMGKALLAITNAIRHVVLASKPLQDYLANSTLKWAQNREASAAAGRESGKLEQFFRKTVTVMKLVADIGKNVWNTFRNIGRAANDSSTGGNRLLRTLRDLTRRMEEWTRSAEGQSTMRKAFDDIREATAKVFREIGKLITRYRELRRQGKSSLDALAIVMGETLSKALENAVRIMAENGPRMAKALVNGFLAANVWGKLLIGGWLIGKLGGWRAIGAIGGRIGGRLADNLADRFIGIGGPKLSKTMGRNGRVGSALLTGAKGLGIAAGVIIAQHAVQNFADEMRKKGGFWNDFAGRMLGGKHPDPTLSDEGREVVDNPGGGGINWPRMGGLITTTGLQRFQFGGLVDSIPALLTPGEFVMRPEAVAREGLQSMRNINEGRQGFAQGGVVGGMSLADPLEKERKRTEPVVKKVNELIATIPEDGKKAGERTTKGMGDELRKGARQWLDRVKGARKGMGDEFEGLRKDGSREFDKLGGDVEKRTRALGRDVKARFSQARSDGLKETKALSRGTANDFDDAKTAAGKHMRIIAQNTKTRIGEARSAADRGSKGVRDAVAGSYESMDRAVHTGITYVAQATNKGLDALGVKELKFTLDKPKKLAEGGRTGWLGNRGERGGDTELILAGRGEAILNRHQQEWVDEALAATYGMDLDDLFARERRPHYMAKGGVVSSALGGLRNFAGGGLVQALGPYSIPPISYDANHAGGNSHLHISMSTMGAAKALAAKMQKQGWSIGEATWAGGLTVPHQDPGHYDGRAFDANTGADETQAEVAAVARLLRTGKYGNGTFAGPGRATWNALGKMNVRGPGGALKDLAQAAINKVTGQANKFGQKKAGAMSSTYGGAGGGSAGFKGGGTPAKNRALGIKMAKARGWGGAEWRALDYLWGIGESAWDHHADNPESSAYGIPQAMAHLYPETATAEWRGSPAKQIAWGLNYIAGRYGSPTKALAFWRSKSPHWYKRGGVVRGAARGKPARDSWKKKTGPPAKGTRQYMNSLSRGIKNISKGFNQHWGLDAVGTKLGNLQTDYDFLEREYDVNVGIEEFVIPAVIDKEGNVVEQPRLDMEALAAKARLLDQLVKKREEMQRVIETAKRAVTAMIQKLKEAIHKLNAAKRGKNRGAYEGLIDKYQGQIGELRKTRDVDLMDMGRLAALDTKELQQELGGLWSGQNLALEQAISDLPTAETGGGEAGGGAEGGMSEADVMTAAREMFAAFTSNRSSLFGSFGSNFYTGPPGVDAGTAAAGFRNFGAFGQVAPGSLAGVGSSLTGSPVELAGGSAGNQVQITNHFAAPPPDPHTWTQQQRFKVEAALG